jgi:hypothetical protein
VSLESVFYACFERPYMTQRSVTIGFTRYDGDFAILATLNNKDEHLSAGEFNNLIGMVREFYNVRLIECIQVLEREDTPDYVSTDPSCW